MHHIVSWNSATPGMLVSQRKSSISYQPPLGHRISVYPTAHFVASDWSKRTHQHLKTLHPGRACSNRKTPGICIHIVIHSDLMKTWCDFWSLIHRIYVKLSPTKYIYIIIYIYIKYTHLFFSMGIMMIHMQPIYAKRSPPSVLFPLCRLSNNDPAHLLHGFMVPTIIDIIKLQHVWTPH